MKRAIIAVIASMLVFSAAFAAETNPAMGGDKATKMSKEECDKARAACVDQACRDKLDAESGCAPEAK